MKEIQSSDARLVDERVIEHVTRAIVAHFQPQRIILFGSQARGDARRDSDLDLCVVMETSLRPIERIIEVASIFKLPSWPMDIVVYTPQEFEERRQINGSFAHTIDTEGKVLYDAGVPVHSMVG